MLMLDQLRYLGSQLLKRAAILSSLLFLIFANIAFAQDDKPLGDLAREARAAKSSSPKSAKVVTNDDVSGSRNQIGAGKLSSDKQALCDELHQRKDPTAEQACALLSIDMGSEYEGLTARAIDLGKGLCGASGGAGLPVSPPKDPALAAQARELGAFEARFMEMMKAQMKTSSDAEGAVNTVRQEEYHDLAAEVPDWRHAAVLEANAQEKQRSREVHDRYKSRIREKEDAVQQIKLRSIRFLLDFGRMEHVCDHR
jgi:hypothetical protein